MVGAGQTSRRAWLVGTASELIASGMFAGGGTDIDPRKVRELLNVNDLDREIWQEELEEFVPHRLYDVHSHLSRAEFNLDPVARYKARHNQMPSAVLEQAGRYETLEAVDQALMPGREVNHLIFPFPQPNYAFGMANDFVVEEAQKKPGNAALMMVHPSMRAEELDKAVRRHRFVGFKPYLFYAVSGDIWNSRIPDFMPEHQLAVANHYGLMIGLHISKAAAIADPENLDDLERLTGKYPRVRWMLFHNARSYSAWAIERAEKRLRNIPNLWYESSSVCETDAFDGLLSFVDPKRFCYGTDDLPIGVTRGKLIVWGHAWTDISQANAAFGVSHCDGRFTFVRYEMLRAMRRAAKHAGLTRSQIEDVFHNNADTLIEAIRTDLTTVLGF